MTKQDLIEKWEGRLKNRNNEFNELSTQRINCLHSCKSMPLNSIEDKMSVQAILIEIYEQFTTDLKEMED